MTHSHAVAAMPQAVAARLITATLFVGCLPHAIVARRSVGDTLAIARDAVAQIYSLPG